MVRKRSAQLDDEALARLVGEGDAAAFEQLYDRHHRALLAFCRHMLGNREDGEDALQQAFLRAHRALSEGRAPDAVRPWLFAIARNRCLTLLAARRDVVAAPEDAEPSFDGLAADVERRSDLKELLGDLSRLPDEQRGALVLAELGDFNHVEIGAVLGCPAGKVKALVFQARTSLIADRDARRAPCDEIRTQLETGRGGVLRRGPLRRHLKLCDPCAAYRVAMEGRRTGLAILIPVAPTAGLKAAVLAGAGGLGGGAEGAAAAAALLGSGGAGAGVGGGGAAVGGGVAAAGGGVGVAAAGGVAVKALATKVAVAVALGAGASGGAVAVQDAASDAFAPRSAVEAVDERPAPSRSAQGPAAGGAGTTAPATGAGATVPASFETTPGTAQEDGRPGRADGPARARLRRAIARRLRGLDGPRRRRVLRRLLRRQRLLAASGETLLVGAAIPAGRKRRRPGLDTPPGTDGARTRRPGLEAPTETDGARSRRRPELESPTGTDRPRRRRPGGGAGTQTDAAAPEQTPAIEAPVVEDEPPRRRRRRQDPAAEPPPTATPAPTATPVPVAEPDPAAAPRRRRRPPEEATAPAATPAPAPAPAPAATSTPDP